MAKIPLTSIQQADINMSLSWKENSRQLFELAKDLEKFSYAVHWCGRYANVSRTVPKGKFDAFVSWLYDHFDAIKNGTFSYTDNNISDFSKYPRSWIAKICHIINPHAYPLIWDSHVREWLKKNNITWENAMNDTKSKFQNAPDYDIYLYDSTLWACE